MQNNQGTTKPKEHSPAAAEIKELRLHLSLTQSKAAEIIHCTVRGWQQYESGGRKMHPAFWELFKIKTSGKIEQ